MIGSYVIYAFRNLVKQKRHTLTNLFGLSMSIAILYSCQGLMRVRSLMVARQNPVLALRYE